MSEHGYCFLASFAGTWCAIAVIALIVKARIAIEEFCRSDYTKEQEARKAS